MRRALALAAAALGLVVPAGAGAASADSLAPATAPPHWLPPEAVDFNHWLPFDKAGLYRALGTDRAGVWRQLRDDHHTLAELVVARGDKPETVCRRTGRAVARPRQRGCVSQRCRTARCAC